MIKYIMGIAVAVIIVLFFLNSTNSEQEKVEQDGTLVDMCPLVKPLYQDECNRIDIKNPCNTDDECRKTHETQKCCWTGCQVKACKEPIKVSNAEKAGSCAVSTYDPNIMCDFIYPDFHDCRHDSECPGSQKCCANGPCAFMTCKQPVEEREGRCPNYSYDRECKPFNEADFECRQDADCKNGQQKCCRDKCFLLKCLNPA